MSEKIEKYNDIAIEVAKLAPILVKDDHDAELEAVKLIRELRQGIERLRRVVGESDTDEPPRSLTDMNKLHKDELAFVLKYFWDWCKDGSGDCPAFTCRDFPCRYRQHTKMDCEENLKNGDLDEAGFKDQQEHGFYAEYCDDDGECCWAEYYLWCYRNGVDPLTGKKDKPNNHK